MAERPSDKEVFFKKLDQLDRLTDDSEDEADLEFAHLMKSCQKRGKLTRSSFATLQSSPPRQLLRTISAPESSGNGAVKSAISGKIPSDIDEYLPKTAVKRSIIARDLSGGVEAEARFKRRRAIPPLSIPAEQQIFKDFVFFFFPNNDVSPLRRIRIQRARDYGAVWARTWDDHVTHVIVDKGLLFQDVLKHLKLENFPPNIALLDESYPSECIKFQSILNTKSLRFHVNGAPASSKVEEAPANVIPLVDSLPLKSSKKQQQNTPTPSQDSDQGPRSHAYGERVIERPRERHQSETPLEPAIRERDALDDFIDATKAAKDLPLDPLESTCGEAFLEASDIEVSDSSDTESIKQKAVESWQRKFTCMQKHDSNSESDNPNTMTIRVLQQMLDYYTRTSDNWRVLAYRKAIAALRRQPKKIVTRVEACAIPGIGPRLADKVEEIVFTNRLRRLENANNTTEDLALQEFLGVYGAGISQASRWVAQGYRSLEDLKSKAILTKSQQIGVDHYYDFSQRIPRQEVEAHGNIVQKAVRKMDPGMQVIISGSYRRGASDSGDIDLLITKRDTTIEQIRTMMMDTVIPQLFQERFLQASLASTSRRDGTKWHGASMLPGSKIWRRIDLLFVPGSEIGAALIYFTGNDIFNRSMRLLASKKGMRLNQRGLYADVLRGEQRKKLNEGRLLEGRDERRIFDILGVPWRPPEHRIC